MLSRVDELWARVERVGIVAGLLVMSAAVFADVVHRFAADPSWQSPGRILAILAGLTFVFAAAARTGAEARRSLAAPAHPGEAEKVAASLSIGTSEDVVAAQAEDAREAIESVAEPTPSPVAQPPALSWLKAAGIGLGLTALLALLASAGVWLFPSGVVWAQTLSLVLMIWVAFLGASLATRDNKHLKMDAAERIFKGDVKRGVAASGNVLAAIGTGALALLAFHFCMYQREIWVETGGAGGDFEGLPIPKFLAFGVLPLTFTTMSLRFLGNAVRAWQGKLAEDSVLPHTEEGSR